ncbi:unnamed protein product [Gadus morhua 'NCC']
MESKKVQVLLFNFISSRLFLGVFVTLSISGWHDAVAGQCLYRWTPPPLPQSRGYSLWAALSQLHTLQNVCGPLTPNPLSLQGSQPWKTSCATIPFGARSRTVKNEMLRGDKINCTFL